MTTFEDLFSRVQAVSKVASRQGQVELGDAVISSIETTRSLTAEAPTGTGKSFSTLIPALELITANKSKPPGEQKRVVVSTETTALQDQLVKKDLPFLTTIWTDVSYVVLKGRSWYLCLNRAKTSVIGRRDLSDLVKSISRLPEQRIGEGQRRDVEAALGQKIPSEHWEFISGSKDFCADAKCSTERCWSARARSAALDADLVVTNHALLRVDGEMREQDNPNLLGDVDLLIVDEAHTLESQLVDGWTQTVSPWDLFETQTSITKALQAASSPGITLGYQIESAFTDLKNFLSACERFFKHLSNEESDWKRQTFVFKQHFLPAGSSSQLLSAMTDYEEEGIAQLKRIQNVMSQTEKFLLADALRAEDMGQSGARKLRKGARAASKLAESLSIVEQAMATRTGIVEDFGVPYAVLAYGTTSKRYGDQLGIRVVPLDVSMRCRRALFKNRTTVLVSATLSDPTRGGDMAYTRYSLGLWDADELTVGSPFVYEKQQLVYISSAERETIPVMGARYSLDELIELIRAANGRALVLFTANSEMSYAADELRRLEASGELGYRVLVQEPGVDKQQLVEEFKSDNHSILLGSRSFMTGVDFPGETCSIVILAKMTLPQYNSLCKLQIDHWRSRGFPTWYEREALLVFSQAMGRLIRSETDRGVIALLDQRCSNPRERVYATAEIGISATGSKVTQSIDDVREFLR